MIINDLLAIALPKVSEKLLDLMPDIQFAHAHAVLTTSNDAQLKATVKDNAGFKSVVRYASIANSRWGQDIAQKPCTLYPYMKSTPEVTIRPGDDVSEFVEAMVAAAYHRLTMYQVVKDAVQPFLAEKLKDSFPIFAFNISVHGRIHLSTTWMDQYVRINVSGFDVHDHTPKRLVYDGVTWNVKKASERAEEIADKLARELRKRVGGLERGLKVKAMQGENPSEHIRYRFPDGTKKQEVYVPYTLANEFEEFKSRCDAEAKRLDALHEKAGKLLVEEGHLKVTYRDEWSSGGWSWVAQDNNSTTK